MAHIAFLFWQFTKHQLWLNLFIILVSINCFWVHRNIVNEPFLYRACRKSCHFSHFLLEVHVLHFKIAQRNMLLKIYQVYNGFLNSYLGVRENVQFVFLWEVKKGSYQFNWLFKSFSVEKNICNLWKILVLVLLLLHLCFHFILRVN